MTRPVVSSAATPSGVRVATDAAAKRDAFRVYRIRSLQSVDIP